MSKVVKFLITLFLGVLGVHKFIDGKIGLGVLYLFTGGLFGIGWFIDTIIALIDMLKKEPVTKDNIVQPVSSQQNVCATPQPSKRNYDIREEYVAGVTFKTDEINSLLSENDFYNSTKKELEELFIEDRIYKYEFITQDAELVPEPTNPYDKNAIKVLANNVHVGYIEKKHCTDIQALLDKKLISKIVAESYGGKYKELVADEFSGELKLEAGETTIGIKLSIYTEPII